MLADVVYARDALVLYRRGYPRLAEEARAMRAAVRVSRVGRVEDLERDETMKEPVARDVHDSHPPAAELTLDDVSLVGPPSRSARNRGAVSAVRGDVRGTSETRVVGVGRRIGFPVRSHDPGREYRLSRDQSRVSARVTPTVSGTRFASRKPTSTLSPEGATRSSP
jgi:hypothetical protein